MTKNPDYLSMIAIIYPPISKLVERIARKPRKDEMQLLMTAKLLEQQDCLIEKFEEFAKESKKFEKRQIEILEILEKRYK